MCVFAVVSSNLLMQICYLKKKMTRFGSLSLVFAIATEYRSVFTPSKRIQPWETIYYLVTILSECPELVTNEIKNCLRQYINRNEAGNFVAHWVGTEENNSPRADLLLEKRAHLDHCNSKLHQRLLDIQKKDHQKVGKNLLAPTWINPLLSFWPVGVPELFSIIIGSPMTTHSCTKAFVNLFHIIETICSITLLISITHNFVKRDTDSSQERKDFS